MNNWQFTPFAYLYLIAALFSFALFLLVLNVRYVRGKTYFSSMLISIGVWVLGYSLGFFSTDFSFKLQMLRVEYLGIILTAVLWFFFVVTYTNNDKWLSRPLSLFVLIIPVLTYLQILFVEEHDFFYQSYQPTEFEGLIVTEKDYGIGFYVWTFYSYLLVLGGLFLLVKELVKLPGSYLAQSISNVLIVFIILVPNALYITGNNPIKPYDPICLSFVLIGIIYTITIYFHKFLGIAPVAHHHVFKDVNSGVLVVDQNYILLDINPAGERIFKGSSKKYVGQQLTDITDVFDDYLHIIYTQLFFTTEIVLAGEDRIYELQTTTLEDKRSRNNGRIFMLYDITERKKAHNELDAYARTVAHNLKTPMNSIIGFLDLMKQPNGTPEENEEYLRYIDESSQKMNSIIDGLLLLSRIRNMDEINVEVLDMHVIIQNVFFRLETYIEKSDASIKYPESWPSAMGYPLWVEEIWINYLTNALKYGGEPPVIEIGGTEYENESKFWVKDYGNGISDEDQKLLFNEFTQLKKNHTSEGFGLGLSIVQRIVKKLNGSSGVDSVPGEGSTFFFTLPKMRS